VVLLVHASEQLLAPQLDCVKSQVAPLGQLQLAPVQLTGVDELLDPQSTSQREKRTTIRFRI
jgi:hypothetical protein